MQPYTASDPRYDLDMPRYSLVVPLSVPPWIRECRKKYDAFGKAGMTEHITIMGPYLFDEDFPPENLPDLGRIAGQTLPFSVSFDHVCKFVDAVFLPPRISEPFVELTTRIQAQKWKIVTGENVTVNPYCGRFSGDTPHLTLAEKNGSNARQRIKVFDEAKSRLAAAPFEAQADRLELWHGSRANGFRAEGRWPFGQEHYLAYDQSSLAF